MSPSIAQENAVGGQAAAPGDPLGRGGEGSLLQMEAHPDRIPPLPHRYPLAAMAE